MADGGYVLKSKEQAKIGGEYTISDLARLYDVSLRTLRFYEDKGLIHPRREGQSRFYSNQDRIYLEFTLKGKRMGFTLDEIRELLEKKAMQDVYSPEIGENILKKHPGAKRVLDAARQTFGDEIKARLWLDRPTKALDGAAPVTLLGTDEGARRVEDLLARIDHGLAV